MFALVLYNRIVVRSRLILISFLAKNKKLGIYPLKSSSKILKRTC
jgi:hypothetical protein